jgi:hypothetical protein
MSSGFRTLTAFFNKFFHHNLASISHNVLVVYDGLATRISKP